MARGFFDDSVADLDQGNDGPQNAELSQIHVHKIHLSWSHRQEQRQKAKAA